MLIMTIAAARALIDLDMPLEEIAKKAMNIASDICMYFLSLTTSSSRYTNKNFIIEILD